MTPRVRARKGDGDRLREELLDSTEALLREHGSPDAISMRSIARDVGVSAPSIYLHFEDKDELVHAVCVRGFERFDAEIETAVAGIDDPLMLLRARGEAYVRFALEHTEIFRVLFLTPGPQHDVADPTAPGGTALYRLVGNVEACIAAGYFEADDPFEVALVLWSAVHGLASLAVVHYGFATPARIDRLIERLLDVQLGGLGRGA